MVPVRRGCSMYVMHALVTFGTSVGSPIKLGCSSIGCFSMKGARSILVLTVLIVGAILDSLMKGRSLRYWVYSLDSLDALSSTPTNLIYWEANKFCLYWGLLSLWPPGQNIKKYKSWIPPQESRLWKRELHNNYGWAGTPKEIYCIWPITLYLKHPVPPP